MALVLGTNCGFVLTAPTSDPVASNSTVSARSYAGRFTSPSFPVQISSMGWWCDNATQAANFELGIYDHDSGNDKPNNLLGKGPVTAKGTDAGWKTVDFVLMLSPSTVYWIAIQLDLTATGTLFNIESSAGEEFHLKIPPQTTLSDPWGTSFTENNQQLIGIYALYSGLIKMQVNISDVWKEVIGAQINIGDAWKEVIGAKINIGDAWKTMF